MNSKLDCELSFMRQALVGWKSRIISEKMENHVGQIQTFVEWHYLCLKKKTLRYSVVKVWEN